MGHMVIRFLAEQSGYAFNFAGAAKRRSHLAGWTSIMASATPTASVRGQSTSAPEEKGIRELKVLSGVADTVIEALPGVLGLAHVGGRLRQRGALQLPAGRGHPCPLRENLLACGQSVLPSL